MKTETIVLHLAALRGPPTARPVGANPGAAAANASRPGLGAEMAILLHHEATARIEEAVLLDHAAADE